MAHLVIRKGGSRGQNIPLDRDLVIFGRSPECTIQIAAPSVSRQHARLVRIGGLWYVEDMLSRNGTYVNQQLITSRTPLNGQDRLRICDFEAVFHGDTSFILPEESDRPEAAEAADVATSSTVEAIAAGHSSQILVSQSAHNLRTILEISNDLGQALELDRLLPKIVENLFKLFPQASRCFLVLYDEAKDRLTPRVVRTRSADEEGGARYSLGIVRDCLKTQKAFRSDDVVEDRRYQVSGGSMTVRSRSVMCVPLCAPLGADGEGRPFGVLQLDCDDRSKKFGPDDLKLLVGVANQASIALQNARLYQAMQEREQWERDTELAEKVQKSILPEHLPEFSGYRFFTHYDPALRIGGDYFDFIALPQGRQVVALGDVAGKSVAAALLMAKLSSDARFCFLAEADPAAALARLNGLLYRHLVQTNRFITLIAATLDPEHQAVTLACAGHQMPLLYRYATRTLHEIAPVESAGLPLGIEERAAYTPFQASLAPGDSLLLFTDGVTDAEDTREEKFGMKGIYSALQAGGPYATLDLGKRLVQAVERHAAGHSQSDDITLVCFGREA